MHEPNDELSALFAGYREALPDPEPSRDFMPRLWRKIEARRTFTFRLKRLAQMFVAGAAAACLLMTGALALPSFHNQLLHASYVDALDAAQPAENLAALGIMRDSAAENNNPK